MSPGKVAVHIRDSDPVGAHSTTLEEPLETNLVHFAAEAVVRLVPSTTMFETELTISRSPTSYFGTRPQYNDSDMIDDGANLEHGWMFSQLEDESLFGSSGFTAINKPPS